MTNTKLVFSLLVICLISFGLFNFSPLESKGELIPYLSGQQYGYSDLQGNIIIPAQYDEVEPFRENYKYALVNQNGKWYVINPEGIKLEDAEYDEKPSFQTLFGEMSNGNVRHTIEYIDGKEIRKEIHNPNPALRFITQSCSCSDQNDFIIAFHLDNFNAVKIYSTFAERSMSCSLGATKWYRNNFLIAEVEVSNKASLNTRLLPLHKRNATWGSFHALPTTSPESNADSTANADNAKLIEYESGILYTIFNSELEPILESFTKPEFLNDKWIYHNDGYQAYIYDLEKQESTPTPFKRIAALVEDKYLIVSGGPIQKNIFGGSKKYGFCDLDFNLILDTTYSYISQQGDLLQASEERFKYHLFDYQGHKLFDSARRIDYSKKNSHYMIEDSLNKVRLYKEDLTELDGQEYENIESISSKKYRYTRGVVSGIMDSMGQTIIEYPCDRIDPMYKSDFYNIVIDRKSGVIDEFGKLVVPAVYGDCYQNPYNLFQVSSTRTFKNGLLNMEGKIILDTFYDRISYDSIDNQLYIHAERDRKWTYFDTDGKVVQDAREDSSTLWTKARKEEFAKIQLHYIQNGYGKSASEIFSDFVKKHDAMSPTSVMVHRKSSDEQYACTHDLVYLADCDKPDVTITKYNAKNRLFGFKNDTGEGIVNFKNEIVLPPKDRKILAITDYYILIRTGDDFDFYDMDMKKLYPFSWDYVDDYNNDPHRVVAKNITGSAYEYIRESCLTNSTDTLVRYKRNYGYVNRFGKISIPPKFASADDFDKDYALVGEYNKDSIFQSYVIDTVGNIISSYEPGIRFMNWSADDPWREATKNNLYGMLDSMGNTIVPFKYTTIRSIHRDKLFVISEDRSGPYFVINSNETKLYNNSELKEIGPSHYGRKFIPLEDGRYVFAPNDHLEIIDFDGKLLLKLQGQNAKLVKVNERELLEVEDTGLTYYVDPVRLISYRE